MKRGLIADVAISLFCLMDEIKMLKNLQIH